MSVPLPPCCPRTISLCLRVRLRLLTAGLLLLRAAGGTAEEAAAAAAASQEGGGGGGELSVGLNVSRGGGGGSGGGGGGGSVNASGRRRSSGPAATEDAEDAGKLSRLARVKLLRRACGTLAELDALEEALRGHRGSGDGGGGRGGGRWGAKKGRSGTGVSTFADGGVEAEGDRTLRANLAGTCVSIMEEMTIPRGYMGGVGSVGGAGRSGGDWEFERCAGGMAYEVERIVEEEKVRDKGIPGSYKIPFGRDRATYFIGLAIAPTHTQ